MKRIFIYTDEKEENLSIGEIRYADFVVVGGVVVKNRWNVDLATPEVEAPIVVEDDEKIQITFMKKK